MKKLSFYFLLILIFVACKATKYVSDGEYLLSKNTIYLDGVKYKKSDLEKYILQKPNTSFLGLPIGLYIHNLGNPKGAKTAKEWGKERKKSYNFVKKIFSEKQSIAYANYWIDVNEWLLNYEKPEIINDFKVKNTKENLEAYYKTQGYFNAKVNTIVNKNKNKKATVEYRVSLGELTLLDSIRLNIQSFKLDSIYKKSKREILLKKGHRYKDQEFRAEAKKMVKLFRNSGIYNFNEEAIGFYVDSTRTDNKTNVDYIIDKERVVEKENGIYQKETFKVHTIRKINVYTDYTFSKEKLPYKDSVRYKGILFLAHNKLKYKPKHLAQSIFFTPNSVYKDTLRRLTRSYLESLKNFKSTNINFKKVANKESMLDMDVYLTPTDKYTLGVDTELTHSNIREIGTSLKFSRIDRNLFKGAELLKISLLGSYFIAVNEPGYEIGADVSLEIPRFVAPFGLSKVVPRRMSPRTLYSLGSSFQKNIGLDRQTFTLLYDYKWNFNRKKTIQLELFNTQYIQNLNIESYFTIYNSEFQNLEKISRLDSDTTNNVNGNTSAVAFMNSLGDNNDLRNSFPEEYNTALNILNRYNIITSDFLIPTLAYSYTYNNQTNVKDNSFSFFKMRLANAGNVLGLISNNRNNDDKRTFLGIPLAQYFKTDFEYKKFWELNSNSVFGIRAFTGAIFTYNNSDIPFTRSYFAGGSNDIRAWQTYELGLGSSTTGLEFNVGSLKFLTSAEYRFGVFGNLKGALFIDAGNIWDITGGDFVEEEAKFSGLSSIKDVAIGTGFGARIDFDFLIVRLDLGFKTYEPYLTGSKWFQNYDFSNSVLNVGINYPF